jgi:hypothetical protein
MKTKREFLKLSFLALGAASLSPLNVFGKKEQLRRVHILRPLDSNTAEFLANSQFPRTEVSRATEIVSPRRFVLLENRPFKDLRKNDAFVIVGIVGMERDSGDGTVAVSDSDASPVQNTAPGEEGTVWGVTGKVSGNLPNSNPLSLYLFFS